jgi:hypothetical protein
VRRLALSIGSSALLVAGFLVFSNGGDGPSLTQSGLGFPFPSARPAAVATPAPDRPAPEASPLERLAQQLGTVCQTPQGIVCTVAPQPVNSRCDCQGSYGIVVR